MTATVPAAPVGVPVPPEAFHPGEQALQALLKENPALAASRAVRDKRLVSLDPTLLVGGLGPRLPTAMQELATAFYPASAAK